MKTSLTEHSTCLTNHTIFQRIKQTLFICECCFLFPSQWLQFKIPQGFVCKQNNDHCQNARDYHKAKTRSSWFRVREEFILLSCCRTLSSSGVYSYQKHQYDKKRKKKKQPFLASSYWWCRTSCPLFTSKPILCFKSLTFISGENLSSGSIWWQRLQLRAPWTSNA